MSRVYRRRRDVRYRRLPPEAIVVRQEAGEVLVLNDTAGRILDLVDGRRTVAEVVDAIGAEYEAAVSAIGDDIAGFLIELSEAGVLEAIEPAPRAAATPIPEPGMGGR